MNASNTKISDLFNAIDALHMLMVRGDPAVKAIASEAIEKLVDCIAVLVNESIAWLVWAATKTPAGACLNFGRHKIKCARSGKGPAVFWANGLLIDEFSLHVLLRKP